MERDSSSSCASSYSYHAWMNVIKSVSSSSYLSNEKLNDYDVSAGQSRKSENGS